MLELHKMHWKNIQKHHRQMKPETKKIQFHFNVKLEPTSLKKKYPSTATLQFILRALFSILKRR